LAVTPPQIAGHPSKTIPNLPLFSGQFKVSFLTPETRSPCWMGDGEGRGRSIGLGNPEGGFSISFAHPILMANNQPVAWCRILPIIHLFFNGFLFL